MLTPSPFSAPAQRLQEELQQISHESDPNRFGPALLKVYDSTLALLPLLERGGSAEMHQNRQAAQQAQGLLKALHQGFVRLAALRHHETGLFTSSRPRFEALGMALACGWQLASLYARTLTPLPPGFWLACHLTFTEIQELGWARRSLKDDSTPGALYRQIMLLGISASNRLEPQKMALLLKVVEDEARFLDLVQLDLPLSEQGAFIYQADADIAPHFAREHTGQGIYQTIETQVVLGRLSSRLQRLLAQKEDRHHEIQLIGRLLQEWAAPPRRRHFRLERHHGEQIQLISQWQRCWQIAAGTPDETMPEPARLSICNISASGLLLQGESLEQPLQAGEVVMLRRGERNWQLGLVRWVSLRGDGFSTECGIELIGRKPEAVHIAPITSLGNDTLTTAISLAADARRGHSGILILSGRQYHAMRMFTVHNSRGLCRVRATRLVMQTAYYQFIEIKLEEILPETSAE